MAVDKEEILALKKERNDNRKKIKFLPEGNGVEILNEQLSTAWNQFLEGYQSQWIRPSIIESWHRSLENNIDPYCFLYKIIPEKKLTPILLKNKEMIEVAKEVMNDLLAYNPDGHINLTDANGITLHYCGQNLTPIGSVLHEDEQGTNCTGLCLIEKKPVYLINNENWKISLRQRKMQYAAAPVKNGQGKMIGVLTLTSTQENFNYQTIGTVHAAAQAIKQQLILRDLLDEQRTILETLNEGVIVFDNNGIIINTNRYSRQVFNDFELIGKHIDRDLCPEETSLLNTSPCNDKEVIFNLPENNSINCLISLVKTPNGNSVVSLKENKRIKDITRRVIGAGATYTFDKIIGNSERLLKTISKAKKASRSNSTILITGESGTGKELFAQAIHNHSYQNNDPFIAVNCGAIPRDLVQSELFGYVDGAYTGSRKGGALGKFELADGGTLFLDEIGEMPLEAQTSLLRVIQEGEVVRIGAAKPNKIDVRIIAATNCDLVKAVENSTFRSDLYYRLNVISIPIPPLRKRTDDIKDLIEFFSARICNNLKKIRPSFSRNALNALQTYSWPGNVRELENAIERLLNLNSGLDIDLVDLPEEISETSRIDNVHEQSLQKNMIQESEILKKIPLGKEEAERTHLSESLEGNEKQHIISILSSNKGNIRKTADTLKISRNCLYGKLKKWEIDIELYRS